MTEIENVCAKFGLSLEELGALLNETDQLRGLLTPADLEAGLKSVLAIYIGALSSTAERIVDQEERLVVDRFMKLAMETLAGQLEGARAIRN